MYNKFKDKEPIETIEMARNTLSKWGVSLTETWFNSIQGLYSVTLQIDGTDFFSCGKGTDKLFALASAYGEMMENMQNLVYFRMNSNILMKDNCQYDDDSIVEKCDDSTTYSNLSYWMSCVEGSIDDEILKKMFEYSNSAGDYIRYERFYNIENEQILSLPINIVDTYYGSNGMSAGNTEDEAYVQAISEILERFVIKEILEKDITPPTITTQVKNSMPTAVNWINLIEERGDYRVELKDLSLGKGIPAIGLILYNRKDVSYFVKVAAHPSLEVAVERCFTELMQGKEIEDYEGMISGSKFLKGYNYNNFMQIFFDGSGQYPLTFFVGEPSYNGEFRKKNYVNNQEMVSDLRVLVNKLGYSIFARNVTKSDFFACRILIPGMSELLRVMDPLVIQESVDYEKIKNIVQFGLQEISIDEANSVLDILKKYNYADDLTLDYFIDLKLVDDNIYSIVTMSLFKCLLYIKVNDIENAFIWMQKYTKTLDHNDLNSRYYFCYELYLALKIEIEDKQLISDLLSRYFTKEIVEEVMIDTDKNPFEYFIPLYCENDCLSCDNFQICRSKEELDIYRLLRRNQI